MNNIPKKEDLLENKTVEKNLQLEAIRQNQRLRTSGSSRRHLPKLQELNRSNSQNKMGIVKPIVRIKGGGSNTKRQEGESIENDAATETHSLLTINRERRSNPKGNQANGWRSASSPPDESSVEFKVSSKLGKKNLKSKNSQNEFFVQNSRLQQNLFKNALKSPKFIDYTQSNTFFKNDKKISRNTSEHQKTVDAKQQDSSIQALPQNITNFLVRPEKTLCKSSTLKTLNVKSPKRLQFTSRKSMSKIHKDQAQLIEKIKNTGDLQNLQGPPDPKQSERTPAVNESLSSNLRTFKSKYMRKMNDQNNLARLATRGSETSQRQSIEVEDMASSNSPIVDVFLTSTFQKLDKQNHKLLEPESKISIIEEEGDETPKQQQDSSDHYRDELKKQYAQQLVEPQKGIVISKERMQGQVVLKWVQKKCLKAQYIQQQKSVSQVKNSFEQSEEMIKIADVAMQEVIENFASTKCQEFAQILREIQAIYHQNFKQIIVNTQGQTNDLSKKMVHSEHNHIEETLNMNKKFEKEKFDLNKVIDQITEELRLETEKSQFLEERITEQGRNIS